MNAKPSIPFRKSVPVIILAGFLGSGKTTFLQQAVERCLAKSQVPAIIMNEVGDVNLDGQLLPDQVAMEELLSGCICCSIRGDFGVKLYELVSTQSPDVIIVECTGIAEPMELVDTLTEVSLYAPVQLTQIITIVDTAQMAEQVLPVEGGAGSKKLERLLREQVRAANMLVLNKCDLLEEVEVNRIAGSLRDWNPTAQMHRTSHATIPLELWEQSLLITSERVQALIEPPAATVGCSCGQDHTHPKSVECDHDHASHGKRSSHEHVTVWTHPIQQAVDSIQFEDWLMSLPSQVYRAKGIVHFTDTSKRYMFQYAYKATQFIPIEPQGEIEDVIVLIGEQIDAGEIQQSFITLFED